MNLSHLQSLPTQTGDTSETNRSFQTASLTAFLKVTSKLAYTLNLRKNMLNLAQIYRIIAEICVFLHKNLFLYAQTVRKIRSFCKQLLKELRNGLRSAEFAERKLT